MGFQHYLVQVDSALPNKTSQLELAAQSDFPNSYSIIKVIIGRNDGTPLIRS